MFFTKKSLRHFFRLFHKELNDSEISLLLTGKGKWNPNSETLDQLKIIQKYQWIFSCVPGLKAVFFCNTTAFRAAQKDSDIDLFVVTENGKLWITRIFLTIFTQLLGIRRYENLIKNRFCLSFFATEIGAFNLKNLQIAQDDDPYFAIWVATLECVFGDQDFLQKFHQENNWIEDYELTFTQSFTPKSCSNLQKITGNFVMYFKIEMFLKRFLLPRTLKKKNLLKDTTGIIISDQYLKFHDNDIRKKIASIISTCEMKYLKINKA